MLSWRFFRQLLRWAFFCCLLLTTLGTGESLGAPCDTKSGYPFVAHDLSVSYCELCGYGYVTVVINNPYRYTQISPSPQIPDLPGALMSNLVLQENLGISGLSYEPNAPNPVTYRVNNGVTLAGSAPTISGSGAILTFSAAEIPALASLAANPSANQVNRITIRFAVSRTSSPEALVSASRGVQATLLFTTDSGCADSPQTATATLPLQEPLPQITKTGWNYDAGQRQNSAGDPVYGTNNDDIVWRVRVTNSGLAGLQDLRFDDLMTAGSVDINYACASEAAANSLAAANGSGSVAGCVPAGNNLNDFIVTNPFGNTALSFDNQEVDVSAGGTTSIYLVGKITAGGSCETSKVNSVSDVQWGCGVQNPAGGISATSTGIVPADTATFYSLYSDNHADLSVERQLTGTNTAQPVGSKGTMTITIRNFSGGSVKNIQLADVLPPEYVVDATFLPEIEVTPAYGTAYAGMVDTLTWTNRNSGDPLANTAPEFDLTSSTTHPVYADQVNMLRHGDVAVVRFRVVLIESAYYDRAANLDVYPEEYPLTGTDPTFQTPLSNTLTVDFDLFCGSQGHQTLTLTGNGSADPTGTEIPAFPEDLDIAVGGDVFILTNDPNQLLTLPILVTNNGGHDATDYHVFTSFGATMEVVSAPSGCAPITLSGSPNQPAPWKVLVDPTAIPATATVYECVSPATIAPGRTVTYNFQVRKSTNPSDIALDDLSLRADVVGEITLSDGTPLTFPAPVVRADGELDRANNYSLDAAWARVIGFNLKKTQLGTCNENNPPSYDGNGFEEVQIGEECDFHIETGGWFGFKTPGFIYIAVQNIDVADQVPDGQAYLSSSNPYAESTALIQNVSLNPTGLAPLDEGWFDWRFNVPDSERIEQADEWFVVNTKTRLLNKPIDDRAVPNLHAADSDNVLSSTFDATFSNVNTGLVEQYSLGPSTVGYPREAIRRVDLTVTEPRLVLVKEVCNESLYGSGPSCSNFVPVADDGDAFDSYIYRITVTNEATADGVQRAPAYDVTVTDQLDASDLAYVFPFAGDGLDNDGDGTSGAADSDGEGSNSDNSVKNGIPAELTFSYTHSNALQRIDPGQSVELYYRVDYDDDAAPLQVFTNAVSAVYDSLSGPSGNQTNPTGNNSELGGARLYQSETANASVQVIPVATQPKTVTATANTPLLSVPGTQDVTIGEELEYQLDVLLPVALVRNFVIRDELPVGLRCSEAPAVNLDAAPFSAAGFEPGGVITPTCNGNLVEWNFGDQRLTIGGSATRFDLAVNFIARLENSDQTNDADLIANGSPATVTKAEYLDESGALVSYNIDQVAVQVREPRIELAQTFSVANADAADLVTVTVTATNSGTAPAYNLRVYDDLTATRFSYAGGVGGTNPPDAVDLLSLGPEQPVFGWSTPAEIAVGASVSFSYQIRVADDVRPHEELSNTIEAAWTSLPAQTTALNSGGSIGSAGAIDGMRNGSIPNSGDPVNDYETTAAAQLSVPGLQLTKTDLNPATVPTIGVRKQFQIDLRLPEGVTEGINISDNLAAAGLSYVLANNSSYDISYSFSGIATINGLPPAEAALNAFPADQSSGTVSWDVGTITTLSEDDSSSSSLTPTLSLNYFARVNNDLDTDAGDPLQNGATAVYLNGATAGEENLSAVAPAVVVSEPDVTLVKTVANVTAGKDATAAPVAGDILEYRLTLVNTGSSNSTAFDLNIVDTLPAGVVLDSSFTPTASLDGSALSGFVGLPAGAPAGPLTWGRGNGDGSLDVGVGQQLVIIYHCIVEVVADADGIIENGVWTDWTSLDTADAYERTGAGCPSIVAPNDYCVGPVFATTVGIAPELVFQKTVLNQTSGADPGVSASPGDVLQYHLEINNISAAQAQFTLYDELDQLNSTPWFVPGSLTLLAGPAEVAADVTGGSGGTGLLSSSNIVLDGNSSLSVDFSVQLAAVIPGGSEVLNQARLTLTGFGTFTSDDPNIAGAADPTRTLIASAPQWQFSKTSADLTGASSILLPGDQLRYTILVRNIGTEDAANVVLTDAIPANTSYVTGSTTLNGVSVADAADGSSPLVAGLLINAAGAATIGEFPADSAASDASLATVTFVVQIDSAASGGTEISNQAVLNGSGTGSGVFTEQLSDDPDTVAVADPTIDVVSSMSLSKAVFNLTSGGSGATAVPGDVLHYRLKFVNTGTATLSGLSIRDELESLQVDLPRLFVPGTLQLETVPAGADVSGSDANGGNKGSGLLVVDNLTAAAGETLVIEFNVQLAAVITSGSEVLNQAELRAENVVLKLSDSIDSALVGETDPTVTLISSAPAFQVEKTASFLDGDPTVLLAGERLRYTVTVKNIGSEDAHDVMLQDYTPANTSYIVGSTTLNGQPVSDNNGANPLHAGLLINAAEDATAGYLRADSAATANNVATVTFDVLVDSAAMDGLVLENQAFVNATGAGSGEQPEQPSDDPATPAVDDPTRVVVGNVPLLYVLKTAALAVDNNADGIVNPGDTIEYSIVMTNNGAAPATASLLTDAVPANLSYVADSLIVNGVALGSDGGVFPLAAGLGVQSADNPGSGIISMAGQVTISYRMRVNAGVAEGTRITNQAILTSNEVNDLPSDADGLAANGYQETVVVVGAVQLLEISKTVALVDGISAEPGTELVYSVRVTNIGSLPASNVLVTDDLSGLLSLVDFVSASAVMDGSASGTSFLGGVLSADYSATYGNLSPGGSFLVRFQVRINSAVAPGTTITNSATVSWDTPTQSASASVSLDVGGTPGSAALNGLIWHDSSLDRHYDEGSEIAQQDWVVALYLNGSQVATTTTDADGSYAFSGLLPTASTGVPYEIRFTAPGAGIATASLGSADSIFTNGPQRISAISVDSGSNLQNLNMPLWPNGSVYNAVARSPVSQATLTLLNALSGNALPGACFDDPVQQNQVTAANGFYKFDLNFSQAACPAGGTYLLQVTAPPSGYLATPSALIPPSSDAASAAFSVPDCPGSGVDAVPATSTYCEAIADAGIPAAGSAETTYYLHLALSNGNIPGQSQIFNNQLPIDPVLSGAVALSKVAGLRNVSKGSLVPYTIRLSNVFGSALDHIRIVDRFPAGFKYVAGSATLDGVATEPDVQGRELSWDGLTLGVNSSHTIKLLLVVGAGVGEGEYVNRAQAYNTLLGTSISGEATATVMVVPDPDFDCSDVIGKVYDDRNLNGRQDEGEAGLAGVRVVTARGLVATTDEYGRYHLTCAVVPDEDRGSNFIMKLDDRSLPSGYRVLSENPRVQRATRGKMLRFNFTATPHRVVGLDIADAAFEPGTTRIRPQWQQRLTELLKILQDAPSILRLSYLGDTETAQLAERRLDSLQERLRSRWPEAAAGYRLTIETQVFWRRGGPP
ncbi:SdrD B-like domain-containing protein [Pelobacter seleniigenes]|uniref:SdrD B-like domain-containing protein n=1 Tax=Pelobacter seleniigenes TaxID=407188 RepID=UPI000689BD41|nr:SdrD B-like domain-containing protein [Pelobacter seleniigenes]